jgi:hypothetical protein
MIHYPTWKQVRDALRAARSAQLTDNPFVILEDVSDFHQGYIQAIHTEDGWWVEVRQADGRRHFRSPDTVGERQTARLFEDFLQVGIAILDSHPWNDVTDSVSEAMEYRSKRMRKSQ